MVLRRHTDFVVIGSSNGFSPVRRQAITPQINVDILSVDPWWSDFDETKFESKHDNSYSRKRIWNCRLQNGSLFARTQCVSSDSETYSTLPGMKFILILLSNCVISYNNSSEAGVFRDASLGSTGVGCYYKFHSHLVNGNANSDLLPTSRDHFVYALQPMRDDVTL